MTNETSHSEDQVSQQSLGSSSLTLPVRHTAHVEPSRISSDRPEEGLVQLRAKLAKLIDRQGQMKRVNAGHAKFLRSPASIDALQLTEEDKKLIREFRPKNSWETRPFPAYELTYNSANIRRVTDQIAEFEKKAKAATQPEIETECSGYCVRQNFAANRVQLLFPGKPAEVVRTLLKRKGFRWSPTQGAWQRHLNDSIVAEVTTGYWRTQLETLLSKST